MKLPANQQHVRMLAYRRYCRRRKIKPQSGCTLIWPHCIKPKGNP